MKKYFELTRKEHEIMDIFWSRNGDFTANDLISLSPDRTWSEKSLHVILNNLVEKGALEVVAEIKIAKTKARVYNYAISQNEYAVMQYKKLFGNKLKPSVASLVSAIYENEKDKDNSILELEQFLNEEKQKRGL